MLGTLLLSTGTPMLLAGDERWRTQSGNNNAYCLDDPTSWSDWSDGPEAASLTAFTALVAGIRHSAPALQRDRYYRDGEVLWWHPEGRRLRGHDWHDGHLRSLGLQREEWLLLLHAGPEAVAATLPSGPAFVAVVDSSRIDGRPPAGRPLPGGTTITLPPRSLLLLRQSSEAGSVPGVGG
jgi:glycogen operon protein